MEKRYAPVKITPDWEPKGVVPSRGYDRIVRARVRGHYVVTPPMPPMSRPRPIAVIEAEIRRATVPALRPEQV